MTGEVIRLPTPKFCRDAVCVLRRAFILAALVCRTSTDSGANEIEANALHTRIREWLSELEVWDEAEPEEKRLLAAPFGSLSPQEIIRVTWYAEGLAILAWAVEQREFPVHDQKIDPYDVAETVGFLSEEAKELLNTARLRDQIQMDAASEVLYAIHARLRDFIRHKNKKDFASWLNEEWLTSLRLDASVLIANGDLAIDNKPISHAREIRLQECSWIALERHRMIEWLGDTHIPYSQVQIST